MGRIAVAVAVLVAGLVVLIASNVLARAESDGIRWESDLVAARSLAAEKGRPLMVVFR